MLTFAVLGDNRGDSDGVQSAVFAEMVRAVNEASPQLVLNVGDMINGYAGEDETQLRRLWKGYQTAAASLNAPIRHVPGNHDVFDALSASLWQHLWGPTYYAFEEDGVLFIALDTETEENRLGPAQFDWLARQLQEAAGRTVFVFLHRPLFPVNGHRGLSLDVYPEERDRLHQLFMRHRRRIKGVFQGHEHLYHFEQRDGVPYYILGGGGEELYAPPELGGFYHFLLVRVEGEAVQAEVRRVGQQAEPPRPVTVIEPGVLLEEWRSPHFWYTWDHSVTKEWACETMGTGTGPGCKAHASGTSRPEPVPIFSRGLRVWFDFARYEWPVLMTPIYPCEDWSAVEQVCVDVFVPECLTGLEITLALLAEHAHQAPSVPLLAGWNAVAIGLDGSWLPAEARRSIREVEWHLSSGGGRFAGWVVFDHCRTTPLMFQETWEGGLLWGAYDETVRQARAPATHFPGGGGLQISFDLARCPSPVLYAALNPVWDLSRVRQLTMDVYQPESPGVLQLSLMLVSRNARSRAPAMALRAGWNKVAVELEGDWLAPATRARVEQMEWELSAREKEFAGWILLGNLKSA